MLLSKYAICGTKKSRFMKKHETKGILSTYNHFHNILRLFGVLPNCSVSASETMRGYYI